MTRKELLQIAKPILFNTEMVRAILDGRKTVTRRVIKEEVKDNQEINKNGKGEFELYDITPRCGIPKGKIYKPPYQPGDILYVRESVFQGVGRYLDVSGETVSVLTHDFEYYADGLHGKDHWKDKHERTWMHRRPSIHMPKEAARIFLKVKDVRVERLQEITWQQATKEGCQGSTSDEPDPLFNLPTLRGEFQKLWDSTIDKSNIDRYGWDANPWVWVIEFEVIEPDCEV